MSSSPTIEMNISIRSMAARVLRVGDSFGKQVADTVINQQGTYLTVRQLLAIHRAFIKITDAAEAEAAVLKGLGLNCKTGKITASPPCNPPLVDIRLAQQIFDAFKSPRRLNVEEIIDQINSRESIFEGDAAHVGTFVQIFGRLSSGCRLARHSNWPQDLYVRYNPNLKAFQFKWRSIKDRRELLKSPLDKKEELSREELLSITTWWVSRAFKRFNKKGAE